MSEPSKTVVRNLRNRWRKMIARCEDPRTKGFHRWGGRGIRVCAEWRDPVTGFQTYLNYVLYEAPRPAGISIEDEIERGSGRYSLDRWPDNDGHYQPGNLRWSDAVEQSANQARTAYIESEGAKVPRTEAAREHGVDPRTASRRQRMGYSGDEAVTLDIGGRTAAVRRDRDLMLLSMAESGELKAADEGFVFVKTADGWIIAPLCSTGNGRYLGVSITVAPKHLEHTTTVPRDRPYRSTFQHSRVVALVHHSLPDADRYYEVHHLNQDKTDNRKENLEWRLPCDHRADDHAVA